MRVRAGVASLASALSVLAFAQAADAQSAVPIGIWTTVDGSEMLVIERSATCRFSARGGFTVLGRCSWNPSSRGGILTILNQYNYKPAPIYYNVVWVNASTISVFGDIFHKRAN
jgi:hypothetical protein